jgi:hypothetical protein
MSVPLQWTGERDGEYRGTFVSVEPGAYEVTVDATRSGGQAVGSGAAYVRAGPSEAEFFDPTMHAAPLQRIAEETGGRFYTPDGARGLTEDIRHVDRGTRTLEHANHPHRAHGSGMRRVGLPAYGRTGVRREGC